MFLAAASIGNVPPPRARLLEALGRAGRARAELFLSACPSHQRTPVAALPAQAKALGIASLHIKDEGPRFGLGSFKALGGAYAVLSLVHAEAERRLRRAVTPDELLTPEIKAIAATMTVTCATDGNHGRSVAAGARIAGCRCIIFIHGGVTEPRASAIAAFGADVRRTKGSYDDSVREAAASAEHEDWIVVSDTSWDGYEDIPRTVMQGYTVMAGEAFEALPAPPTHLFLQAGVGGMAAAVAAHASAIYGANAPRVIVVEPERAACVFACAKAGKLVTVPHSAPTVMSMLECYEASPIAWEILASLASGFVTLDEDEAIAAMRQLAFPLTGDPAIVAGESGGTGFAGLVACLGDAAACKALGLGPQSRVLVFNSEGATDPDLYRALTGTPPNG
jgi:diaminopropionate ammonia-lyase